MPATIEPESNTGIAAPSFLELDSKDHTVAAGVAAEPISRGVDVSHAQAAYAGGQETMTLRGVLVATQESVIPHKRQNGRVVNLELLDLELKGTDALTMAVSLILFLVCPLVT